MALLTSIHNISFHAEICHGCSLEVQHKESVDRQADGRTDRSKMTHIRTWPRSYPDKHFGQVRKFSVAKYSSYPSIKKVWTDRWTDRRTPNDSYSNLTTNILIKFESSRKVFKLSSRRTDRQTVWWADDVITIFFNVGALIIMHKKGLLWLTG